MYPSAPEFVPSVEDLMYNHMMQADRYAQEQMQMPMPMPHPLFPGGRPPATPHSDRSLFHPDLQKPAHVPNQFGMPTMDQAFAAVRSINHGESMAPPPPQHAPSEPQWSPSPTGDAPAGFASATGFFTATTESAVATPVISPKLTVARPPPGLEEEATIISVDPATSLVCVDIAPVMQDMCTQTEGPACRACGACFGCAGKCPWSRDQLLGLREAFLRTKVEPKDSNALKAVRYGDTTAARKRIGGA